MAKTTIVQLSDDIDGSEAVESLTFALRGVEYEIDLNAKNVTALEKALDKYVSAGRRVSRGRITRATSPRRSAGAKDLTDIRAWARKQGYKVSDRGRISQAITDAYAEAHG